MTFQLRLQEFKDRIAILDAHHHFWDLTSTGYWPWIQGPVNSGFFLGDYASIRRQFTAREYQEETAGWNVVGTVHCEAERARDEQKCEVVDLARMHQENPRFPAAIVAHVDFLQQNRDELLEYYAGVRLVSGVRSKPSVGEDADASAREPRGSFSDKDWLGGLQALSDLGLSYDLRVPYFGLHEAALALRNFPDLDVIVNHCGLPLRRDAPGLARWEAGMKMLSARDRTYVKVSELGIPGNRWDPESNTHVVTKCIELFGWKRCMFASNMPVARVCAPSFDAVMESVLSACINATDDQLDQLFRRTAAEVYKVELLRSASPLNSD